MNITSFSRSFTACAVLIASTLFVAGCGEDWEQATKDAEHTQDARPAPKLDDAPQAAPAQQAAAAPQSTPAPNTAPAAVPAASPAAGASPTVQNLPPQMEKMQSGVGVQGQGYGGGILTEPVTQYFQQRDRIAFEIQVPHQLQLWKAEHNNRNPRDKKEYVKEILEPCGVTLPDLPPGKQYYYDAKTGDLLVGPEKK